jgi:hypothetical protein
MLGLFGMDEALKQSIRRVAEEQWPGCVVDVGNVDRVQITNKYGRIISNNVPPFDWQNALDDDEKIRSFIRNVCR